MHPALGGPLDASIAAKATYQLMAAIGQETGETGEELPYWNSRRSARKAPSRRSCRSKTKKRKLTVDESAFVESASITSSALFSSVSAVSIACAPFPIEGAVAARMLRRTYRESDTPTDVACFFEKLVFL